MKLTDKNNAVHFLLDKDPMSFQAWDYYTKKEEAMRFIGEDFPVMKSLFRERIQFVSAPFYEAFLIGKYKLMSVLLEEAVKQSGTMIIPDRGEWFNTFFYDLETSFTGTRWVLNGHLMLMIKHNVVPEPTLVFYARVIDNVTMACQDVNAVRDGDDAQAKIGEILGLILFMKFCAVESKVVPAGRNAVHVNEMYANETALPIEILDSTWLTTIVESEGFLGGGETGGFFKWQRAVPGHTDRKIIYVAPIAKKGYTRKAKVLGGNV
jgi:hypothetical protein